MDDFEYKNVGCYYRPHPKLYGNYEVYLEDDTFLGRFNNRAECRIAINAYFKSI